MGLIEQKKVQMWVKQKHTLGWYCRVKRKTENNRDAKNANIDRTERRAGKAVNKILFGPQLREPGRHEKTIENELVPRVAEL